MSTRTEREHFFNSRNKHRTNMLMIVDVKLSLISPRMECELASLESPLRLRIYQLNGEVSRISRLFITSRNDRFLSLSRSSALSQAHSFSPHQLTPPISFSLNTR